MKKKKAYFKINIMTDCKKGEESKRMEKLIDLIIGIAEENDYELCIGGCICDEDGECISNNPKEK